MVQFSFLNRLEKIGILEFCCTSFRELLFSFYLCALPIKFALPAGCRQSSQAREGRTTQLLFFSCCKVSLSTVELQHEWIQNLPKMSLIPPEMKRNLKKEKKRANQSDWVLQQGIPSAALFMKGGAGVWGKGGLDGEAVQESYLLLCTSQQTHFLIRSHRSICFCNVYTYIYNYIEQSSSCLLEVFSVFRWLVTCKDVTVSLLAH